MTIVLKKIKGDKLIWAIATLLAIVSFLPVYSAASNLAYIGGGSNTFAFFIKHFVHLLLGFIIMYSVHKIPYRYFRGLSIIMIPVVLLLLALTMFQGDNSESLTNARRWIRIPFIGFTFQPSTLASVVLMVYVARYLSKIKAKKITFRESIFPLWTPVFLVLGCILPANFSTAALIFFMVIVLVFLGGYPKRYIGLILLTGALTLALFILLAKAYPKAMPNRIDTWTSRIESFMNGKDTKANYQIEKAKIAIASGGIRGLGPGKSKQKNFLPQSSSDFIFAIIIEEYGLLGAVVLISLYLWLLFRILIVSQKSNTFFGKLLAVGVGLPIIFQALVNMGVAVEIFPVTGQTLPLISSGGTSIWMTCLSIGIVLSVSVKHQKITKENKATDPLDILRKTI